MNRLMLIPATALGVLSACGGPPDDPAPPADTSASELPSSGYGGTVDADPLTPPQPQSPASAGTAPAAPDAPDGTDQLGDTPGWESEDPGPAPPDVPFPELPEPDETSPQ